MTVFLIIAGEIVTLCISRAIMVRGEFNMIKQIGDAGFKIDRENMKDFERNSEGESDELGLFKKILNILLTLLPGVNILSALYFSHKINKAVFEDKELVESLVPMTTEEKKEYDSIESLGDKVYYISKLACEGVEEEVQLEKEGIYVIRNDHLPALAYTYEELKYISNYTNQNYTILDVDGRNIALLGEIDIKGFDKILLKSDPNPTPFDFNLYCEDLERKKFLIFPLGKSFEEDEILREAYNKVVEFRNGVNLQEPEIQSNGLLNILDEKKVLRK